MKLICIITYILRKFVVRNAISSVKNVQKQITKRNGSIVDKKLWNFCIDGYKYHCIRCGDLQSLKIH